MSNKVLEINEKEIKVYNFEKKKFISKHTGRELLEISFRCDMQGIDERDWLLRILNSKEIMVMLTSGEKPNRFIQGEASYNYSTTYPDEPTIYTHNVSLREKEIIDVKIIKIDDLVLEPYVYEEEESSDTQIEIEFKVVVNKRQREKLIQMLYSEKEYFNVIREGIDDNPREMRFGLPEWSRIKNKNEYKYRLILIDYNPNEKQFPIPNKTVFDNLMIKYTKTKMTLDMLIERMKEKKILKEDDIYLDLKEKDEWKKFCEMHHDLYYIFDVDTKD